MKWSIVIDHIDTNAVGITSQSGAPSPDHRIAFRMYDDDDTLYYSGYCEEEDFSPLDDFGTPNTGCTYIKYRQEDGTWTVL